MSDMNDFERRLRASLDKHAAQAPRGDGLDELIIAEAVHGATPIGVRRRSARTWMLPMLAAAAVAAVVLSIVGITAWRPDSSPAPPAHSDSSATFRTTETPAPTTRTPSPSHSTTPKSSKSQIIAGPTNGDGTGTLPNGEKVHGFTAADLTFISSDEGWALGSAKCLPGEGTGRCTAIYRTTDGSTWTSVKGAAFNVPGVKNCAAPCVSNIRFADESTGYAYGPSSLWMTTDGGAHWTQQPGGAVALETFDGNVIRLVSRYGNECGAGCSLHVETAPIGSSDWTTVTLPGGEAATRDFAQLTRTGSSAYILLGGNPVGGGDTAFSTLYSSSDDGATWTEHTGDPCPQLGNREVDARAISAAAGGVTVLCTPRQQARDSFAAVSTDGGATFRATTGRFEVGSLLAGDPDTVLVAAGADAERSTDGGETWHTVAQLSGRPGGVTFVGFESETVGRAITDNGTRIWTTSDGGKNWSQFSFPT